jgi:hypothetical protein
LEKDGKVGAPAVRTHNDNWRRIRLYAAMIAALAVLAALTTLAVPSGTSAADRCSSIVQQNRYGCMESIAVATGNSTICGSLPGYYSDSCYTAIAENSSDASLCGKISSRNLSNECLLAIAQDTNSTSTCMMMGSQLGESCIYQIALDSVDEASCRLLNDSAQQANCSAAVYMDKALAHANVSLCDAIPLNGSTNMTYNMLGNSDMSNYGDLFLNMSQFIEYAMYSNESVGPRDACYLSIAFESGNSVYCGYMQEPTLGYLCKSLITRNVSLQQNLINSSVVNSTANYTALSKAVCASGGRCTYESDYIKALISDNVSVCASIPAQQSYQCYFAFAEKYNDTSYCSYIKNSTINSDCVLTVSGYFGNGNSSAG